MVTNPNLPSRAEFYRPGWECWGTGVCLSPTGVGVVHTVVQWNFLSVLLFRNCNYTEQWARKLSIVRAISAAFLIM